MGPLRLLLDTHALYWWHRGDTALSAFAQAAIADSYDEPAITGEHVLAVTSLPPIHKHPFHRILVAHRLLKGSFCSQPTRWAGRCGRFKGGAISNQKSRSDRRGTN